MQNNLVMSLKKGGSTAAIWLALGAPVLAEFAADAGAAAVVLDLQHGLWQRRDTEAAIGHIRASAVPLVRVAENRPRAIGEALDAGALGVIVPVVETAAEAQTAVAAAKYPPFGKRSAGGIRPLKDFAAYVASANAEILVAVMVETARAVENLAEIIAVAGVDMIFVGPGDLALSLREFPVPGEKHAAAIAEILTTCKKAGMPCGIFTPSPQEAARRLAEGFQFVTAGDDISLMRNGLEQALATASSAGE